MSELKIKFATSDDTSIVLEFIKKLADYEKLSHEVVATEEELKKTIFAKNSNAEVILGFLEETPVAFALFFHNYSTFLAKKGLYLEDLFVLPEYRRNGFGKIMLKFLAKLALERNCGRFEWSVLDWNKPAIDFYKSIGAEQKKEWLL
ncbi:MAG: GNAT family N-acetyltransferase, partial [Ignavibacteriae bacterium]|nr:GNAT family N-acetyltransferase [Ignavibacteriota bacterium]